LHYQLVGVNMVKSARDIPSLEVQQMQVLSRKVQVLHGCHSGSR
jgi:hypothetical protein